VVRVLDLSSNNGVDHDFAIAYARGGQRRVYLKAVQGTGYVNPDYALLRPRALGAKLHVGAYDYLEPLVDSPRAAAEFLVERLPSPLVGGRDLRPALDVEQGPPSPGVGAWVSEVAAVITRETGVRPLVYGSPFYLEDCAFDRPPGPLWLADYGPDDGRNHPVTAVPRPWKAFAAHQFTDRANVAGIDGPCDLSYVRSPAQVEVPASA
jgi:GH25 family lysozyme M1 (1,4-beta-N-acetylmuramidase)